MRKVALGVVMGLGMAALAAPSPAAADMGFRVRLGDITGEGGKLDKKTGQQLIPISSWFWGEYIVANGAAAPAAELQRQGYWDTGSVRVNGKFSGCEVGKTFPEAEMKTPGARYTFQDVAIARCGGNNIVFNYGKIRASGAW